jgi:hypothetical protein
LDFTANVELKATGKTGIERLLVMPVVLFLRRVGLAFGSTIWMWRRSRRKRRNETTHGKPTGAANRLKLSGPLASPQKGRQAQPWRDSAEADLVFSSSHVTEDTSTPWPVVEMDGFEPFHN